jgi:hypothetical protein
MKSGMKTMPKIMAKKTIKVSVAPKMDGVKKSVLKAAKKGAKSSVKSAFKFKVADAKMSKGMGSKPMRNVVGEARKGMKSAKKEIKKYTDY